MARFRGWRSPASCKMSRVSRGPAQTCQRRARRKPEGKKQIPSPVQPLYFAIMRGSNKAMPVRFRTRLSDAWRLIAHSLSGRLLLLTVLYVMVSEVAIFVPSIGRFYVDQLSQRIETAEIAILPFTESS